MKSGRVTMDELYGRVAKILISYKRDPDFNDLVQEGVVVALENPNADYNRLVHLVRNNAIKHKSKLKSPVYVPYDTKFDKRMRSSSRELGKTSSVQVSETDSIGKDHSDDVLLSVSIESFDEELREFSHKISQGQSGLSIRDSMGLTISSYYKLISKLRRELYTDDI
jgi:hypothetical protein